MSGAGRVVAVNRANEPKTNRPALLLITDYVPPPSPDRLVRNAVWIAEQAPAPPVGAWISWDAHHLDWSGVKLKKLGNECDPNDPALYTG